MHRHPHAGCRVREPGRLRARTSARGFPDESLRERGQQRRSQWIRGLCRPAGKQGPVIGREAPEHLLAKRLRRFVHQGLQSRRRVTPLPELLRDLRLPLGRGHRDDAPQVRFRSLQGLRSQALQKLLGPLSPQDPRHQHIAFHRENRRLASNRRRLLRQRNPRLNRWSLLRPNGHRLPHWSKSLLVPWRRPQFPRWSGHTSPRRARGPAHTCRIHDENLRCLLRRPCVSLQARARDARALAARGEAPRSAPDSGASAASPTPRPLTAPSPTPPARQATTAAWTETTGHSPEPPPPSLPLRPPAAIPTPERAPPPLPPGAPSRRPRTAAPSPHCPASLATSPTPWTAPRRGRAWAREAPPGGLAPAAPPPRIGASSPAPAPAPSPCTPPLPPACAPGLRHQRRRSRPPPPASAAPARRALAPHPRTVLR